jgi:hypothetical protein
MRLCALLETSDGEYHICCGQFSSFRPWSLLLSNLKLRSRSLSAMMDLMRNRANFALTDSVYKSRSIAQGQDSERKSSNFRLADDPGVIRQIAHLKAANCHGGIPSIESSPESLSRPDSY